MSTWRLLRWALLVLSVAATEDLLHPALGSDDECGSSASAGCALEALQRRGLKKLDTEAGDQPCFKYNFYWMDPSGHYLMPGAYRTVEASPEGCQARCGAQPGCGRFSFWPDGGCLLTGDGSTPRYHYGVVSGPRACTSSSQSKASVVPDAAWVEATGSYVQPRTEYIGVPGAWDAEKIASGRCSTASSLAHEECFEQVKWARDQGIWASPSRYPGLVAGASSLEEFQFFMHMRGLAHCPVPCLLEYPMYSTPTLREPGYRKMKGIAYGAAPLKSTHSRLTNDDFMADITGAQLFSWGRGDMQLIKNLGANTMRMYGNDANTSHRTFLDEALRSGIDIVAGMSDFGFIQGPDNCILHDYNCFQEAHFYYKKNLLLGFTVKNFTTYHPALKALIMANEPDLKVRPRWKTCRATASIFDGILQAEKEVGVTGNPVALTFTWSFANFHGPRGVAALGQMEDFWQCIQNPGANPTYYQPKNDLVKAFRERFVNSFNTANTAREVRHMFLEKYGKSVFWSDEMKIPVFTGEYHSIRHGVKDDLTEMMSYAKTPEYPFFLGYNFFEFSRRYDKGGSEAFFGMLGYGDCILMDMNYSGQVYTVWDLKPMNDKEGYPIVKALKSAFGTGSELPDLQNPHLPCRLGTMGVP